MNFVPCFITFVILLNNFMRIFAQTSVSLPPDVELLNSPGIARPNGPNGPNLNHLGRSPYRQFDILPHVRVFTSFN